MTDQSDAVDELVHLDAFTKDWAAAFAQERERIGHSVDLPLEHIGSTAVPGLLAKPIIDIQIGTPGYPPPVEVVEALDRLGYEGLGEAGVSGRLYFRLRGPQSFNVHVVLHGGEIWCSNLRLRDFLRHSATARAFYAHAKREAIARAPTLLAYSAAKADALALLISQMRAASLE